MKRKLATLQTGSNSKTRDHNMSQSEAFMFCNFHITYGFHTAENCFTKYQQRNHTCTICRESPQSALSTSRHSAVSGRKLKATEPYVGPLGGYPKPQQFVQSVSKSTTTPRIRLQIWNCSFNALVDSKARRSLISNTLFDKLRQQEENLQYSKEVAVDLFDIRKRPLICQGTVEVNVLVEEERPREPLKQEFLSFRALWRNAS
ncbi:Uncharacterized protein APZ42_029954 [Daphnia magna]|uniref:Uncharacterized protein n=1 Tax=Daphnia magna TaxID=35525 RepID=A0A164P699_9CRUS|nr:Uncharacterized protein APZ42_029954 [Daphnia magna]